MLARRCRNPVVNRLNSCELGVPERCRKRLLRLVEIDLTERGRIGAVGLNRLNRLGFGLRLKLRHGPGRGCSRGGGRSVARDACVQPRSSSVPASNASARAYSLLRRYRVETARAVWQGYVCVAFGIFVRSVAGKPRARALAAAQRDKVQPRRRVGAVSAVSAPAPCKQLARNSPPRHVARSRPAADRRAQRAYNVGQRVLVREQRINRVRKLVERRVRLERFGFGQGSAVGRPSADAAAKNSPVAQRRARVQPLQFLNCGKIYASRSRALLFVPYALLIAAPSMQRCWV